MKYSILCLLMLAACSTEQLTAEQQHFKEHCIEDSHEWMKMSEIKEGMMTGPPCYGCMPDEKTHLCTQEEYEAYVK